jgi:fructose-bisphosphate aldolase class I
VILYDETIRQTASAGTPFPRLLAARGLIPGIKVDTGAKPLAGAEGESVAEGLDGLRERLVEYRALGARFAKWRAVLAIGDGRPSRYCVSTNAHALARYAALCQEAGIVPIVEPEVLMDGEHSIDQSEAVTGSALRAVFAELFEQRVNRLGTTPWQLSFSYGRALQATPLTLWSSTCSQKPSPTRSRRRSSTNQSTMRASPDVTGAPSPPMSRLAPTCVT